MRKLRNFIPVFVIVMSCLFCACKKDTAPAAVTNPGITGKWTHTKNIDWYTNLSSSATIKDTTNETHDVYLDFQSNGSLYQKVWNEVTAAYDYDTSTFIVNGNILTISGSDFTLTDPYNAEISLLTSTNLNFHTIDTVSNYKDENWDYFVK